MMMNTGELIQNKKFTHKTFCIVYSILFTIAWFVLEYGCKYTGKEVMVQNLVFITLFTVIIIIILAFMFTERNIQEL